MARRSSVSALDFVKVYAPMAKSGKSALEIGQALGFEGDAKKISVAVSVKASQLRKRFIEAAQAKAKSTSMSDEDTAALVAKMGGMLPHINGGRGRKSNVDEVVSALDAILTNLDAPVETVDAPTETEDTTTVESNPVETEDTPAVEETSETPKRGRRK